MSEPPTDRFRLHALGTPDLRAPDGRRIGSVLSQPKRLALLTYLALAPEPVPRGTVIATFWPESDEARARNALSQALFHLRRALGEDVVESVEGDRLWASPERLWCDVRELMEGGRGATAPDPAAAPTGHLLAGWTAEDAPPLQAWLDEQRAKIRDRAAGATSTAQPAMPTLPTSPPPTIPTAAGSPPPPRPLHLRWAALAGVVALAIVIGASRLPGVRPSTEELLVLLPRLITTPGAADLSPQVILDEVLAHLPQRDGLSIIPAPYASSVPDFRTQLTTIGSSLEDAPDWILEVSVRVGSGEVGVVGLLYRTPTLDVPGRESFGVAYDVADRALLEVPREVGRGVAAMVERALEGR
jgi:hypothetical protein